MERIYKLIMSKALYVDDVELHNELRADVIKSAVEYAWIRSEWANMTREERIERDAGRSAKHNLFISNLTILYRYLRKLNPHAGDLDLLEDLLESDRKEIGDFACFIAYQIMLENR